MSFTIAHLTDVHLSPIDGFTPRHWSLKRALGYANWLHQRRGSYDRAVLDRIVADIVASAPDHIAVTGDLVNIGLPQELINALAWLETLGPPQRVSVVPGNHDVYARLGRDPGTERWARYMASDAGEPAPGEPRFPYFRRLGPIGLIGVNSAVPTPPLIACGRVGQAQRERLARLLATLGREGFFRLVLIHHPPLPGQSTRLRCLQDAAELKAVLVRHGAELVIHGHNHINMLAWCGSGRTCVPVVGAPAAALARARKGAPLARHNLYRIAGPPWKIELIGRGLVEPGGPIVEVERRQLHVQP